MPTLRLDIELDSEVYPELHAALSALSNPRSRGERLRQLAATGLVWEKVRLHGAAAGGPLPDLPSAAAPSARAEPLPAIERRAPAPATAASTSTPAKRARASAAPKRRVSDFVDLAISAEPTPVPLSPPERRHAAAHRRDVEQVIRELPVLMDVVMEAGEDAGLDPSMNDAMTNAMNDARPPALAVVPDVSPALAGEAYPELHTLREPAHWAAMNAYPDGLPEPTHSDDDDDTALPEDALHVTALAHKPATRSRLMRMKERGLFKNG